MKTNLRVLLLLLTGLWATAAGLTFVEVIPRTAFVFGAPGTHDFLEYWSAYQIFQNGGNPYDPYLLLLKQREYGWNETQPLMMWNPPWLLTLFAPILSNNFGVAAFLWLSLGLTCVALIIYWMIDLWSRGESAGRGWMISAVAAVMMYPVWSALYIGQISLVLAAAATGLYWSMKKKRPALTGFFLSLLSLKFHLFLPLLLFLFLYWTRRRDFQPIVVAALFLVIFIAGTVALEPDAMSYWMKSYSLRRSDNVTNVFEWRTATLVSAAANIIYASLGHVARWVLVLLGPIGLIAYGARAIVFSRTEPFEDEFVFALAWSILWAPFAWIFDHAILFPVALAWLLPVCSSQTRKLGVFTPAFLLFTAVNLAMFYMIALRFDSHHHYFWYGTVFYLSWFFTRERFSGAEQILTRPSES